MIHEMSIRYSFIGSLALLAAAGAGSPLWSQETVWRIGTFDHASAEFGGRVGNQPVVVDAGAPDAARQLARFASGHPQRPLRPAVARPHHPLPDGRGCQRIVCLGPRHHGRQSPRAPSGYRTQRRAGHGVHRPPPELPRRGTSRFADLRRSQRAHPHPGERAAARRQRTAHHRRGRRGGRKRRFADQLGMRWRCCAPGPGEADPEISVEPAYFSSKRTAPCAS